MTNITKLEYPEFFKAPFLRGLGGLQAAVPQKSPAEGLGCFSLLGDGADKTLWISDFILREDKSLWEAVKEMFSFAVKTAEASLRGSYELELCFVGDFDKLKSFQPSNLAGLIVNHAKKLEGNSETLFYYSGGFLRLKRLAPLDWGKIGFKHHFTILPEREKLSLLVKKAVSQKPVSEGGALCVLRDFSHEATFRFGSEPQTERLEKLFKKSAQEETESKAVYLVRSGELIDLRGQFSASPETS